MKSSEHVRRHRLAAVVLFFAAAAALAGCTQYAAVKPEARKIGGAFTVDPQIAWSSQKDGKAEVWTVDGPLLESLRFVTAIGDGDAIFDAPGADEDALPRYRKQMTEPEIAELVTNSLAAFDYANATTSKLQPARFGALRGFRFELGFTDAEGLEWRGLVVGAQDGDKLHLILYTGTAVYYYGRYIDQVERLLASIQT